MTARSSLRPTPRLASLAWSPYALPFVAPLQTAHERFDTRRGFLVRAVDTEGLTGFGEAAPMAGFGVESLADCAKALDEWGHRLTGKALAVSGAQGLPDALRDLDALVGAPAARHALECALADLSAQSRGLPLHRWLLEALGLMPRAAFPERLPVNATLGALAPEAAAARASELVRQGFATLKLKVGVGGLEADRARLRAVRAAVPHAVLRVDANGAWDEANALQWLTGQADVALEYCEQPIPPGDLASLSRLAAASPVAIAADESVASETDAQAVLDARAAQVLILKPMALGGPLATVRVAHRAASLGVPVVVTTALEGAYGRAAAVHVAAAAQALWERPLPAMGLATGALLSSDLVRQPDRAVRGTLAVPLGAGLGLPRETP